MMMRPVQARVATGKSWRLGPLEKDFENHEDVIKNITNPLSTTVSFKIMNKVTPALQKERPPRKDSIESIMMSYLYGMVGHEVSIGIAP